MTDPRGTNFTVQGIQYVNTTETVFIAGKSIIKSQFTDILCHVSLTAGVNDQMTIDHLDLTQTRQQVCTTEKEL